MIAQLLFGVNRGLILAKKINTCKKEKVCYNVFKRGYSLSVEHQLPKLNRWVRLPLSAPKILIQQNEDFLFKPIGLVYHHDAVVYIINSLCELYLITPLGVYQKLSA